jgi:carboxyl-terminal processing protease
VLEDPDDDVLYTGPLVVLTSRVSASASEILAGALRDYRRAVLVGDDHTFGKGTVQSVFPLRPDQGALKVTTALFYRPGGTSTQHDGVPSHVVIPGPFATDAFGERTQVNSLKVEKISPFASPKANASDASKRWKPVSDDLVEELARRSRTRVGQDAFFRKLQEDLAKRASDDGVVSVAELVAERTVANGDGAGPAGAAQAGAETAGVAAPEAPGAEQKLSPQAEEALRVLADLVLLSS